MPEQPDIIPPELREVVKDDDPRDIRRLGFDELSREERQEMAMRGVAARRAKRRARQLAEIETYTQAHREMASQVLGTRMAVLDGLVEEMIDPDTGKLETSRLDEKRLKLLLGLVKEIETRAFGTPVNKTETKGTLDIRAALVDLTKLLQKPDTV